MPKKKIAPEIAYPYFFKKEQFEEAKNKIYRKNSTEINSAITRQKWFKSSPFYADIIEKTQFCNKDASLSERFYCYINGLNTVPVSLISGKPLKWVTTKGRYSTGADLTECALLANTDSKLKKFKDNVTSKNKKIKENFYNSYNSNEYNLYSKEELKKLIENLIQVKDYGRKGKWFGIEDYTTNKDFLCSLLYYTNDFKKYIKDNDWSQRLYIVYYDFNNTLLAHIEKFNKYPHYKSFTNGYILEKPDKFLDIRKKHKKEWLNIIYKQGFDVIEDNYLESDTKWGILRCHNCGGEFRRRLDNGRYYDVTCYHCEKENSVSKLEKNLREEISNFYKGEIIFNNRKILNGKELDIFIPDKNIAIELNGILWHSFGSSWPNNLNSEKVEKSKHYNKYKQCEKLGIQLLQFTDIDYCSKKEIVLGIIKAKLGIIDTRIYARNCKVKEISKKEKTEFCAANHLQGDGHSQIEYGLFYNNELVSVMTFGKRKITKSEPKMEIIRYCNKLNYNIIGGASKLLKYFIKNNKCSTLITYADNSISNGNVYKQLGFALIKETKWNYWYLSSEKHDKLLHRSNFMRHKLNTKLTEKEEMYKRGYRRYYDAGNKVYEMNITRN